MDTGALLIVAVVFAGVAFAAGGAVLAFGTGTQRKLRSRLAAVRDDSEETRPASLIREKYLKKLSPLERTLEELPGMRRLTQLIEQAGHESAGYRLALVSVAAGFGAGMLMALISGHVVLSLATAAAIGALPVFRILKQRRERISKFEEQLPDALDMMGRALRAGTPLMESFRFVADEMPPPISDEFRTTWSHMNYGISTKASFMDLHERMPCVSLRAMTTAVLVQRETGGNLAEILDKISDVLRNRFKFERRLKTLTAEGRMSAWVLILMPFVLSGILMLTSPGYLPLLVKDPMGRPLIVGSIVMMTLGIIWIRRTIRIRV